MDALSEDYPHLLFRRNWEVDKELANLLGQCEAYVSVLNDLPLLPDEHRELLTVSLRKGALATTAIEGNTLTDDDLVKIYDQNTALPESKEYLKIEIDNILLAFNDIKDRVMRGDERPLSIAVIREMHTLVAQNLGSRIDGIPGRLRTDNRHVGSVYRAPDHQHVEALMDKYCRWLQDEFHYPAYEHWYDSVIQAIVAHVYFEWIHPFADGNGRTGRLIEFYVLVRAGLPVIAATKLSNHYNDTRSDYYAHFEQARRSKDLTAFLKYAILGLRDGLKSTYEVALLSVQKITWQHLIYERFRRAGNSVAVTKRRQTLVLKMELGRRYSRDQLFVLDAALAREYSMHNRQLMRDINALVDMHLVKNVGGHYYETNHEVLLSHRMPESKNNKLDS